MKLLENEKLTKVNERIKELEDKKATVQKEINEILEALKETDNLYSFGEIDFKDVKKAEKLLQDKTKEIADLDTIIQRVKSVRKSVALESVPFVKEARANKVQAIQKRYDEQATKVIEARNAFLREIAKLGRVAREVGNVNAEFNNVMRELGEEPARFGAAINERTIISGGWTLEKDCVGVYESVQQQAYKGKLPVWAAGDVK